MSLRLRHVIISVCVCAARACSVCVRPVRCLRQARRRAAHQDAKGRASTADLKRTKKLLSKKVGGFLPSYLCGSCAAASRDI
jgi:hypothetical protein